MRYTLHLFAFDRQTALTNFQKQSAKTVAAVEGWACEQGFEPADLGRGMDCVRQILTGDLPEVCGDDHFWAMCWIGEAAMERVPLHVLTDIRQIDLIHQMGVIPLLSRVPAPFAVPKSRELVPHVGYLPWEEMKDVQFESPAPLDPTVMRELEEECASLFEEFGATPDEAAELSSLSSDVDTEDALEARREFSEILESLFDDRLDLLTVTIRCD